MGNIAVVINLYAVPDMEFHLLYITNTILIVHTLHRSHDELPLLPFCSPICRSLADALTLASCKYSAGVWSQKSFQVIKNMSKNILQCSCWDYNNQIKVIGLSRTVPLIVVQNFTLLFILLEGEGNISVLHSLALLCSGSIFSRPLMFTLI